MKKVRFEAFAFTGDDGKFEVKDNGTLVIGVLLTGDLPHGEKFFEFSTITDVNTAIDMLTEYNSRKWCGDRCGICDGGDHGILVGLCPLDFGDDTYVEFEFSTYAASCVAFDLVNTFAKYKFGVDVRDEWESSLHDD